MDGSGLTQQPKKQKLNEELDIVDRNIKCLHNLPEEILRYILSLLQLASFVRGGNTYGLPFPILIFLVEWIMIREYFS